MPIHCNIDAKGKRIRLLAGAGSTIAGAILMLVWAWAGAGGAVAWLVSALLLLGGLLAIFEARAGWCAVRAMGFKTPF